MESTESSKRIAVVTGAGRGLGRRVAEGLAGRGHPVALVARSAKELAETEKAIRDAGGRAMAIPADVSNPESIDAVKAAVVAKLGAPQILVNAAGVFGPVKLIKDGDANDWIRTLSINTVGPYLTCRAFVDGMIEAGWGRIINFSSAAALHPPGPLNSAYATSKVALNHFTRHLASELSGSGVTANVVHPGDVKTEMWADIRAQAAAMGPEAEGYRQWADWVDRTGGDDPKGAVELVLRLTADDKSQAAPNGEFLWIENGLQAPIPSWDAPKDERPWK